MKRVFVLLFVLTMVISLAVISAPAQTKKEAFKYEDPIGVVKIKKGEPIHIASWMVIAGENASLGTDTRRGVEIATEDKGGKLLGHPIKLTFQDTGCNAEGA